MLLSRIKVILLLLAKGETPLGPAVAFPAFCSGAVGFCVSWLQPSPVCKVRASLAGARCLLSLESRIKPVFATSLPLSPGLFLPLAASACSKAMAFAYMFPCKMPDSSNVGVLPQHLEAPEGSRVGPGTAQIHAESLLQRAYNLRRPARQSVGGETEAL